MRFPVVVSSDKPGRSPDFVLIGAMKSGTTTLYRWLESQPEIWLPAIKEPNFFSDDAEWLRGLDWYQDLFAPASATALTGEASVSYTDPRRAPMAAERMARTIPDARLIYLIRHPLERARSHYRHEVQRNREKRRFIDALRDADTPYVGFSLYHTCLKPYLQRFGREQLRVIKFEELTGDETGWRQVLQHLGLQSRPKPSVAYNVTRHKRQFSPVTRRLWDAGHRHIPSWIPGPVRRVARALLIRDSLDYRSLLESSTEPIPTPIVEMIWQDIDHLQSWLAVDSPIWDRRSST